MTRTIPSFSVQVAILGALLTLCLPVAPAAAQAPVEQACFDGVDNDGDTKSDCADSDCAGKTGGSCATGQKGICAAGTLECDSGTAVCKPDTAGSTEGPPGDATCKDGKDNDCDDKTDDKDPGCRESPFDTRPRLGALVAVGVGVDNFAAPARKNILNPEESNQSENRFIGGFDIEYRLARGKWGSSERDWALWVSARTIHGVRSGEVDCGKPEVAESGGTGNGENGNGENGDGEAANGETTKKLPDDAPPICQQNLGDPSKLDVNANVTYILREASSLEGWGSLRFEFLSLGRDTLPEGEENRLEAPAGALYLAVRLGFLSVKDTTDDVSDDHFVGLGAVATEGRFRGSFLEAGWGKTELFGDRDERWKTRAFLKWRWGDWEKAKDSAVVAFAGIIVDTDFSGGSDSIQSYFGLAFDVSRFMGGKAKTTPKT